MDNQLFTKRKQSVITGAQQSLLLEEMMREDWTSFRTRAPGTDVFYPANSSVSAVAGSNFTPALNDMHAVPVISPRRSKLVEFGVVRQVGLPPQNVRFGIYRAISQDNLYPRDLLYDSGTVVMPAAVNFTSVQPKIVLENGWLYWLTFVRQAPDSGSFSIQSWSSGTGAVLFAFERARPTGAPPAHPNVGLIAANVSGALPHPFPANATRVTNSVTTLFVLCRYEPA